jgi:hypothetical protein
MQGYVLNAVGSTDYYTCSTGSNGTCSTDNFDPDNPPSDYSEAEITAHGYTKGEYFAPETKTVDIVVERGVNRKVNIDFDVSNTLAVYNIAGTYQLMPQPPTVTVSVE